MSVVVGNPKAGSRTRQAAELVVERLSGCCPTPARYRLDSSWEASPELDTWLTRARDVLN